MKSTVIIFLFCLSVDNAYSYVIVANCKPPMGWRVNYGDDNELDENHQIKLITEKDGFSGSHPQFIYDTDSPEKLVEVSDPIKIEGVDPKVVEELMPSEVKEYVVVSSTDQFIAAIDVGKNYLWTYTLYPELEFLVIGRNTKWGLTRTNAVGATYYAKCKVIGK